MLLGIGVRSPTSNASASPFRLRGAYLTGAFCVTATGAWYLLRTMYHAEAKVTLAKGPGLAAVLVPVQLFFGHLNGRYVGKHQPSKMAAIEARWNDEKPASEVLIASMSCNRSIMPA
jgi:cytochrome d ubiquinol oxidase subunit I